MKTLDLFFRVVKRDRLLIACALFLILVVGLALIGIHFTGYTTTRSRMPRFWAFAASSLRHRRQRARPSDAHPYGAQISLFVAATGTLVSLTVGVAYGMVSGYAGGASTT